MVTRQVTDLGWVGLDFDWSTFCPILLVQWADERNIQISHQNPYPRAQTTEYNESDLVDLALDVTKINARLDRGK